MKKTNKQKFTKDFLRLVYDNMDIEGEAVYSLKELEKKFGKKVEQSIPSKVMRQVKFSYGKN